MSPQGEREEIATVDMAKATQEANELYQAGEKKWGTDESKFNQILALRSFPQLRATFQEYSKVRDCGVNYIIKIIFTLMFSSISTITYCTCIYKCI